MTMLARRGWREAAFLLASLAILAALVYGPDVLHGGFTSDAWSNRSIYLSSPSKSFSGELSYYLDLPNFAVRPLFAVYIVILNAAFGSHFHFWLAWLVATNVVMSACLYILLRQLSFAAVDAGMIAILVLLFPAATSLRFWPATVQAPAAISFALLGFSLALVAFGAHGRARFGLHCISLLLFAASLLLYEVALPLMLASVLLYRLRVGWREAAARWAADCIVLLCIVFTVTTSTPANETQNLAGMWSHARAIVSQAKLLFLTVVLPFASAHWYILLMLALLPVAALVVYRRSPVGDPNRRELGRWLACLLAGLVVVGLSYAIYVPGVDYYVPMGAGIANRVNAMPSVGFSLIVYAGAMLASTLAFRDFAQRRTLATLFAAVGVALLAVGWVNRISADSNAYRLAFAEDERVLDTMRTALPDPPMHSTIWTFGQPVEIAPGIPVFGSTWDMTGSVQLTFDDPTLTSYVAFPATTFACQANAVVPGGNPTYAVGNNPKSNPFASTYGHTYFLDTTTGKMRRLNSRAGCVHARKAFPISPPLPPA